MQLNIWPYVYHALSTNKKKIAANYSTGLFSQWSQKMMYCLYKSICAGRLSCVTHVAGRISREHLRLAKPTNVGAIQ